MSIASFMFFPILFLYLAVPTALLSILQYFLSRLESPWPGRVLPILSVVSSLCWTLVVLFNIVGPASPVLFLIPLAMLVVFNIPTLIFLLVYKNTRKKFTERRAMDRKDLQDL
ncbi:hypothetical protein [Intestinimonas sp.]|uniref:hypothetical protein n=1 Tax=Intestinimonas sp. TaxID=1965293 RepID=UPI002635A74E|nr:hypothetical protein [Intestinimonas sp.]